MRQVVAAKTKEELVQLLMDSDFHVLICGVEGKIVIYGSSLPPQITNALPQMLYEHFQAVVQRN
jgi:hypothetical protein